MKTQRLNIQLDKIPGSQKVRLSYWNEGKPKSSQERFLDYSDIEALVNRAETNYFRQSPGTLSNLGKVLYDWLDGPDRFLERAILEVPTDHLLLLAFQGDPALLLLPWELLHTRDGYLIQYLQPEILPVRLIPGRTTPRAPKKRALQVLFMATSPENVQPELSYEAEEASILEATDRLPLHLVVEESGNLRELSILMNDYGEGYFDVVHLSGHAESDHFLTEDEFGRLYKASAIELFDTFQFEIPPLLFLSGCHTGGAGERGNVPSLAESLVRSGFPAVLGWARPVLDYSATRAASLLYKALSSGAGIPRAIRTTMGRLLAEQGSYPDWHLLRLYLNGSIPANLIVKGRYKTPKVNIGNEFLDPITKHIKVPNRRDFIGRRRSIQQCLRVLRTDPDKAGVVIYGMGGVGKSSVAARLRMRLQDTHRPIVLVGRLDQNSFELKLTEQLDNEAQRADIQMLDEPLRYRLQRAFAQQNGKRLLFILDDFEQNMELDARGKPVLSTEKKPRLRPEVVSLLDEIVAAIQSREDNLAPQLIITCRYALEAGFADFLEQIQLKHFRDSEWERFQKKKGIPDKIDRQVRIERIANGNPRLYEWLLEVASETEETILLDRLEAKEVEFREDILAEYLLEHQSATLTGTLRWLSVFEIPVPVSVLAEVAGNPDAYRHLQHAQRLSLADHYSEFYGKQEAHYRLAEVIKPLLPKAETEHYAAAAVALYQPWTRDGYSEAQALEMLRLAELGEREAIILPLSTQLSHHWVNRNRFRDAKRLCERIIAQYPKAYQLLLSLARAEIVLGAVEEAKNHLEQAREYCPDDQEDSLSSIVYYLAYIYLQRGEVEQAMQMYEQALSIQERIGDEQGKSATLHEMAYIYRQRGEVEQAMQMYEQALSIHERISDEQGKSATLHEMAYIYLQRGEVEQAMQMYEQALSIKERIGDEQGKSATLNQMAYIYRQRGEVEQAMQIYEQTLSIKERIGDERGKSTTLHEMAYIYRQRGEVEQAMQMYEQALSIRERIGDEKGKSATLHQMAYIYLQRGEVEQAMQMYEQALSIDERIGDVKGKAITAAMMAQLLVQEKKEYGRGLELMNEAVAILAKIKASELDAVTRDRNSMFLDQIQYELGEAKLKMFLELLETKGSEEAMIWLTAERKRLS